MDAVSCWLALARAPATNRLKLELIHRAGSVQALFTPDCKALAGLTVPPDLERFLAQRNRLALERDRAWMESSGCALLPLGHPDYPPLLAAIDDPPAVLFVLGDPKALSLPQLALVGSRNPTPAGIEHAADFAGALARLGIAVTSGLAVGIDAAGHRAALEAGGSTVAVAGNGLDRVYPAANAALAKAIIGRGAIVSEFPPGAPPLKSHFPRRNRLISGLSLGVLVVEAALKSGSLITARLAAEQGRDVFALPGSVDNPLARGCHRLIRDGAKLVESVADIVPELAPMFAAAGLCPETSDVRNTNARSSAVPGEGKEKLVLRALGHDPATPDMLVERTGLTPEEVSSILLALEMDGYVLSVPGGFYSRTTRKH